MYDVLNRLLARRPARGAGARRGGPTRLFIDRTDLSAGGGRLSAKIRDALDDSEYLLVIVSKDTAASTWVPVEVSHFLERRQTLERVIFVVLDMSKTGSDSIDLALHEGLPAEVYNAFDWDDPPLCVDLRKFRGESDPAAIPELRDRLAQAAATLTGIEARWLIAEDLRQLRRREQIRTGAIVILSLLLFVAAAAIGVAVDKTEVARQQSANALQQRDQAIAIGLAALAEQLASGQPNLAKQLALTAYHAAPDQSSVQASVLETAGASGLVTLSADQQIATVAASPDGRLLAAVLEPAPSSHLARLVLWDLRTRRVDWTLSGIEAGTPVVFSPSGRVMALVGAVADVNLWNVADPVHPTALAAFGPDNAHTFPGDTGLALSPDGRTLAVFENAYRDIWLWDIADPARPSLYTHSPLLPGTTAAAGYNGGVFTADDRALISTTTNGEVDWINVANPRAPSVTARFEDGTGIAAAVAVSPDGHTLAVSGNGSVALWDTTDPAHPAGPRSIAVGTVGALASLAFSSDGSMLAMTTAQHDVACWTVLGPADVRLLTTLPDPDTEALALSFGADRNTLDAGNNNGTIASWPLPIVRGAQDIPQDRLADLAFSPDGSLLAGADADGAVWVWDASDPRRLALRVRLPVGGSPATAVAFAPGGRLLAAGAQDGSVRIWRIAHDAALTPLASLPDAAGSVGALAFDRRAATLAVADSAGDVVLWSIADPGRPARLGTIHTHTNLTGVEFDPAGGSLAAVGPGGEDVSLWNTTNLRAPAALGRIAIDELGYDAVAYSPDGGVLDCAGLDGVIQPWNVANPSHPVELPSLQQQGMTAVTALAYSPDGSTLVSTDSTSLRFWSVADPKHAQSVGLLAEPGNLDAVAVDPVDGYATAGGFDGSVLDAYYAPAAAAASMCAGIGSPISAAQWTEYVPDLSYVPPCSAVGSAS